MAFGGPPKPGGPDWFSAWFAFCAVVAVVITGVGIWAVITLVNHVAG